MHGQLRLHRACGQALSLCGQALPLSFSPSHNTSVAFCRRRAVQLRTRYRFFAVTPCMARTPKRDVIGRFCRPLSLYKCPLFLYLMRFSVTRPVRRVRNNFSLWIHDDDQFYAVHCNYYASHVYPLCVPPICVAPHNERCMDAPRTFFIV